MRKIKRFITNVWKYREWLSQDGDWDWEWLAQIMEIKLRNMARCFEEDQSVVKADEMALQCLEAAKCLNQMGMGHMDMLYKEGYGQYEGMNDTEKKELWDRVNARDEANRKRFGELMSKIEWWWA